METKETYEGRIDGVLKEWKTQLHLYDAKLRGLKFQAKKLAVEKRGDVLEKISILEEKIGNAKAKLEEGRVRLEKLRGANDDAWEDLKSGGQMAWEDLKAGVEKAWEDMKQAFDSASTRLSDKNGP